MNKEVLEELLSSKEFVEKLLQQKSVEDVKNILNCAGAGIAAIIGSIMGAWKNDEFGVMKKITKVMAGVGAILGIGLEFIIDYNKE